MGFHKPTVDSRKFQHGRRIAGSFILVFRLSVAGGWRTLMFQLSGFSCRVSELGFSSFRSSPAFRGLRGQRSVRIPVRIPAMVPLSCLDAVCRRNTNYDSHVFVVVKVRLGG